ncbi:MAG: type I restriction-modification system subunit M N-terminal domain-containing protein [Succinivibrio sp.]|nr:type I restriction-modification system subunit M N-terminal domain-containing protein [Succinivibrio sp.]
MISTEELKNRLWNGANELRGSMDASRYKDYMLGLMFYKFLSDKTLQSYASVAHIRGSEWEYYENYRSYVEKHTEKDGSMDILGGSASFRTSPFYGFRPLSLRRNIQYQDSHTLVS